MAQPDMTISDPDIDIGDPVIIVHIEAAYEIGARVYHRVGKGCPGLVTGYLVRPTGLVYQVTWGETAGESGHFGFELTAERPL